MKLLIWEEIFQLDNESRQRNPWNFASRVFFYYFYFCFLNSSGRSRAKSKTPQMESYFHPINGHWSPPSLTTSDIELVSVQEARVTELGVRTWDLWLRGPSFYPLYHGLGGGRHCTNSTTSWVWAVTPPTLPRAGWGYHSTHSMMGSVVPTLKILIVKQLTRRSHSHWFNIYSIKVNS